MDFNTLMKEEVKDPVWELNKHLYNVQGVDIDKYLKQGKIPLGTIPKHWSKYTGEIPEEAIHFFKFSKISDPQSILVIGGQGTGKTMLVKNLLNGHKTKGYYTCVFEPKTAEWIKGKYLPRKEGIMGKPSKIDFLPLAPSFILDNLPEFSLKDYEKVSLDINDFIDKRNFWRTLGIPSMGTEWLRTNILKYQTIKKLINVLSSGEIKIGSTRSSLLTRLQAIDEDFIFSNNYTYYNEETNESNTINLIKLNKKLVKNCFNKHKTLLITFFSPEERYISAYFYYTMRLLFQITSETSSINKLSKYHKKFVVVDDCDLMVGKDLKADEYASVKIGKQSLTLWRALGFMMCYITQSPRLINPHIIDNSKHYFIYKIGTTKELEPYIKNKNIINAIDKLKYNPDTYRSQCCHIMPDKMNYVVFDPFLSIIGHLSTIREDEEVDER